MLRKIKNDSSVRCIPIIEKKHILNRKKTRSLPRKQNKNISQNNNKLLKKLSAQGFNDLKCIMKNYF